MPKRLTVKTIRAKNKVEIEPDASGPAPSAPSSAPKLSMAVKAEAPQGAPVLSAHLQNPYEVGGFEEPQKWTVWAILSVLSALMVIALLVLLGMEWNFYHGGFDPVFMKEVPGMQARVPRAPAAAPAAAEEPAEDTAVEEAPAPAPAADAPAAPVSE